MPINDWWAGEPEQQYWMEVVTTGSMGEVLKAPKIPEASWSYELVSYVRPGDRVLHWQGEDPRGLVGWSEVTEAPVVTESYTWQPRGSSGRALPGPRTTQGWIATLGGFNAFSDPLTASELQTHPTEVLALRTDLERTHGKPIYFPFYLYGKRQLRAQQGYLLKFPLELLALLPKIEDARNAVHDADATVVEDNVRRRISVPKGSTTRIQDPQLRSALELHAVDKAVEQYEARGATEIFRLGKPYDVELQLDGVVRHVEVKGSSLDVATVELTRNEVRHAADYQPTDLVVVDRIEWSRVGDTIITNGGRTRIWVDWAPAKEDLEATKYAYSLPPE